MDYSYLKPKNSLLKAKLKMDIVNGICEAISKEYPDFKKLKNDLELLSLICNMLENSIDKGKGNKLELLYEVLERLYGVPEDKEAIKKNVQFLLDNKKIKRVYFLRKYLRLFVNYFLRVLSR